MKFSRAILSLHVLSAIGPFVYGQEEKDGMTKMCLFYPNESGHARSDPILNQECASDHVHTFYGPQNIHPNTSYEDLRDTKTIYSSSPWAENQSLYWHPSIYQVTTNNGVKTYNLVKNLESSPYYRWNTRVKPDTVAFPPGFRMIAFSDQDGADSGGETGGNLLVECCNFTKGGDERCKTTTGNPLIFPTTKCDFLGVAMAMPTCWDKTKGIGTDDPIKHVTYTKDGTVSGKCPEGFNTRIPQVQLFIRINKYKGGTYQLSDGKKVFHLDFMNGWKEGTLQNIIKKCKPSGDPGYNPPCDCDRFLTKVKKPVKPICDTDVKKYILNEEIETVTELPRGTCAKTDLIEKGLDWATPDPPFQCSNGGDGGDSGDGGDGSCTDSGLQYKEQKALKDCSMVSQNPKKLCKKGSTKSHCPVTCKAKKYCSKDSKKKFKMDSVQKLQKCKWVKQDVDSRCGIAGVCETCRSTCAEVASCSDSF